MFWYIALTQLLSFSSTASSSTFYRSKDYSSGNITLNTCTPWDITVDLILQYQAVSNSV